MRDWFLRAVTRIATVGVLPSDSDEERVRKATLTLSASLIILAGIIWGTSYAVLGLRLAAVMPLIYSACSALTLGAFAISKRFALFRFAQLFLILVLPFATQWSLGGFGNSGAVMLWAFMAPLGALMFHGVREGVAWLAAFMSLAAVSGLLDQRLGSLVPPVSRRVAEVFFVMNIIGVMTTMYLVVRYFVREKEQAQERSERLLLNVLPKPIADRLKRDPAAIADGYAEVTVLFADIVDFTKYSAGRSPQELVAVLNDVFTEFDRLAERHGLEKIKTIGDAYMVVGGLPTPRPDHAQAVAEMALEMHDALDGCAARTGARLSLRIGINTGPVVAGVIGRTKFIYDLWGDTVNTASRMESHGLPGTVQVTAETYRCLLDRYVCEPRGPVSIKGKGEMMTYLLLGRKPLASPTGLTGTAPR